MKEPNIIAQLVQASQFEMTEKTLTISVKFWFTKLRLLNRAISALQQAGYPAYRIGLNSRGKRELIVQVDMIKDRERMPSLELLEDYYGDLQKCSAQGPVDSLQKHVDYRFENLNKSFRPKEVDTPESAHISDTHWLSEAMV